MTQQQAGGLVPEFTIAERLRLARELKHLDQEVLADLIDSSRSTIRNYENRDYASRRKPMVIKLWAMATGVDPGWLESGEGSATPPTSPGGPRGGRPYDLGRITRNKRPNGQHAEDNFGYPVAA